MKKNLIFAIFIVLVLFIGCTSSNQIADDQTNTQDNSQAYNSNSYASINCDTLTKEEIMSAGFDKIVSDSGSEKSIVDYRCQRSLYVRETGKTTTALLLIGITDYSQAPEEVRQVGGGVDSVFDSTCSKKPSLGIGEGSCFVYTGSVMFKKGSYIVDISFSQNPEKSKAVASLIANKI